MTPKLASHLLPDWLLAEGDCESFASSEARVAEVLRLATCNIDQGTGGPFAALVVERDTGRCLARAVNRVTQLRCSSAHAEMLALTLAQHEIQSFDCGSHPVPLQLVVNWRPCSMCFGALLWSGVRSLLLAGSGPELEALTGFDEGPIVPNWINELSDRGVELIDNVNREGALNVFRLFRQMSAPVYNPTR